MLAAHAHLYDADSLTPDSSMGDAHVSWGNVDLAWQPCMQMRAHSVGCLCVTVMRACTGWRLLPLYGQ